MPLKFLTIIMYIHCIIYFSYMDGVRSAKDLFLLRVDRYNNPVKLCICILCIGQMLKMRFH